MPIFECPLTYLCILRTNLEIKKFFLQYGLTRGLFEKLIEARDLFVEDDARPPFFSMEDVDIYSGKVPFIYYVGIVLNLTFKIFTKTVFFRQNKRIGFSTSHTF